MHKALDLLGMPVKDKVSGYEGTVTTIAFDLYGCIQAVVSQQAQGTAEKGQIIGDAHWFDIKRLGVTGSRVMEAPNFGVPEIGGDRKPLPGSSK